MAEPDRIVCVTTENVPGRKVRRVLGLIWTERNTRNAADRKLKEHASQRGADAVIGLRYDSYVSFSTDQYLMPAATTTWNPVEFTCAYGTAVVLE